jgi:hypothetical protein
VLTNTWKEKNMDTIDEFENFNKDKIKYSREKMGNTSSGQRMG